MFEYSALSSSTSIRLVQLSSEFIQDEPAFCISHHKLNETPAYSALSYRWGSAAQSKTVKLNGEQFTVRANLWNFLQQMHHEGANSLFWVDAVCINQDNIPERNQQVVMMAEIYAQAEQVIVWLGRDPHIEYCLQVIELSEHEDFLYGEDDKVRAIARSYACQQVASLDYWKRAWIVQEIALGQTVLLKSGATVVLLDEFRSLLSERGSCEHAPGRVCAADGLLSSIPLFQATEGAAAATATSMEPWLADLGALECTEPRDQVYSLLGLYRMRNPPDSILFYVTVDYSKSVETIYWDCAYMMLMNMRSSAEISRVNALWIWLQTNLAKQHTSSESDWSSIWSLSSYLADASVCHEYKVLARITRWARTVVSFISAMHWPDFRLKVMEMPHVRAETSEHLAALLGYVSEEPKKHILHTGIPNQWRCTACRQLMGSFIVDTRRPLDLEVSSLKVVPPILVVEANTANVKSQKRVDCTQCAAHYHRLERKLLEAAGDKSPDVKFDFVECSVSHVFAADCGYVKLQRRGPLYHEHDYLVVLWVKPTPAFALTDSLSVEQSSEQACRAYPCEDRQYKWYVAAPINSLKAHKWLLHPAHLLLSVSRPWGQMLWDHERLWRIVGRQVATKS